MKLQQSVLKGDRLALARLLTEIEKDSRKGREALSHLFKHTGKAHLVGVTGPPGTGKSSLVNRLVQHFRHPIEDALPIRVAVVAVDPSSPFTGGAVLGDRIRMSELTGDPNVFIRSMASRGSLGGLAAATAGLVQALDAAGYALIFIETVGAGQAEVEIARLAHTTLVVEAPGLGDEVQAIKAGILEIADILVLNKADRPGVEAAERALQTVLKLGQPTARELRHHGRLQQAENPQPESQHHEIWDTPLLRTAATEGEGIPELAQAITRHRDFLRSTGGWQRLDRARLQNELEERLQRALMADWRQKTAAPRYQQVLDQLADRQISPQEAVQALLNGKRPQ